MACGSPSHHWARVCAVAAESQKMQTAARSHRRASHSDSITWVSAPSPPIRSRRFPGTARIPRWPCGRLRSPHRPRARDEQSAQRRSESTCRPPRQGRSRTGLQHPAPLAVNSGMRPVTIAAVVIRIGRSRTRAAISIAERRSSPPSLTCSSLANSTIRIPCLLISPTNVSRPTWV